MDLIQIKVSRVVPAKRWKVLRLITKIQNFPKYMPNVKECRILERNRYSAISEWSADLDGIPLTWKEKDEFDLRNALVKFKAIEGDLEQFEGEWQLTDHRSGGTEIHVNVVVRLGLPMVDRVIGDLIRDKLQKNFETILEAMEEQLALSRYKNINVRKVSDVNGFAVIGHHYNLQHLIRYLKFFKPDIKLPSREFLMKVYEMAPAFRSFDIKNFRAASGRKTHGYFVMCPMIPEMLMMSPDKVIGKVIEACKLSENLGVGVVALGGFTSIAGERYGQQLLQKVHVPLTTGNSLTTAMVLKGVRKAARLMDIDMSKAKATIIGGTGDIGKACAMILAEEVAEVCITSRSEKNLAETSSVLSYYGNAKITTSTDNNYAVRDADIIIAAASSSGVIVDFKNFKPGAVVCDVGYPKNISYTACDRRDILIFSGGIASIPSNVDFGFDVGLPSTRVLYGCFAEAIVLDLEQRYENYSWGKGNITREKVETIGQMAEKHGFDLAPFFWGIRLLTEQDIEGIRNKTRRLAA